MIYPFVSITYKLPFLICTVLYRRFLTEWNFCLIFLPVFMHLFVYTRHSAKCPRRKDRFWWRCHCQKWIQGVLNGKWIRVAAWTANWDRAETKAREMEQPLPPTQPPMQSAIAEVENAPRRVTIEEAIEAFLDDEEGRQLRKGTTGQSKTLLRKQLMPWARQQNLRYLDELTVSVLTRFRAYRSKDFANSEFQSALLLLVRRR